LRDRAEVSRERRRILRAFLASRSDLEAQSRRDRADRERLEREMRVLAPEAVIEENLLELETSQRNDRRLSKV
jgi:hypothetical protein